MASEDVTVTPRPPGTEIVEIWTDGGCKPNPGPGGWAAILVFRGVERELSGGERNTTNNRMELTAAAAALEALTRPCWVVLHTDSEYLKNGITRWHTGWVRKNWRSSTGEPVKNVDLWQRILEAARRHQIEWKWVRSHNGNVMNERVDRMATAAREACVAGTARKTVPGGAPQTGVSATAPEAGTAGPARDGGPVRTP